MERKLEDPVNGSASHLAQLDDTGAKPDLMGQIGSQTIVGKDQESPGAKSSPMGRIDQQIDAEPMVTLDDRC